MVHTNAIERYLKLDLEACKHKIFSDSLHARLCSSHCYVSVDRKQIKR